MLRYLRVKVMMSATSFKWFSIKVCVYRGRDGESKKGERKDGVRKENKYSKM